MATAVFLAGTALVALYLLRPSPRRAHHAKGRGSVGYIVHSTVTHARLLPSESAHAFTYPLLGLLLPLGALEAHALDLARGWLFGYGGLWGRVTGVRAQAYLEDSVGKDSRGIRAKLCDVLTANGHDAQLTGEMWMLTMPSYLGFEGINPLTVYFCEKAGGELWLVVLEIHNTFGERHVHVLEVGTAEDAISPQGFDHQWTFAREFHVSPFNDRSGFYTISISNPWRLRAPHTTSSPLPHPVIRIHLHTANPASPACPGALKLMAVLRTTRAEELTSPNMLRALASQPFALLLSMARIVYHAWILHYRRNLDVYVRPDPLPVTREWGRLRGAAGPAEEADAQQTYNAEGPVGPASGGVGWQSEGMLEKLARKRVEAFLARRAEETGIRITLICANPFMARRTFEPGDGQNTRAHAGGEKNLTIWYLSAQFFTTLLLAPSIGHAILVGSVAEKLFACSSEDLLRMVFHPNSDSGNYSVSNAQRMRMRALPRALLEAPGYGVPAQHALDRGGWGDATLVWTLIALGGLEEFVYGVVHARFVGGQEPWRRWQRARLRWALIMVLRVRRSRVRRFADTMSSPPTDNPTSDAPSRSGSPMPVPTEGGKVKQTRRRQRLSCVECTKRRQKCDRQIPCGLCTSRGIANLCRWEPIVVRPAPQRPPALSTTAAADTIQALSARIAVLEQTLVRQAATVSANPNDQGNNAAGANVPAFHDVEKSTSSSSSNASNRSSNSLLTATGGPRALYDFNVQLAAVGLAQLSLAPREEYIGSGTLLCALHKLGNPDTYRFPYAPSSSTTTSVSLSRLVGMHSFVTPIQRLIASLPPRARTNQLLDAFFTHRNWQICIYEAWFRDSCNTMWRHLDRRCPGGACLAPGICTACLEDINPHWLSLLFAVLALTPRYALDTGADCAMFFAHALTARRLVEDILLAAPAYSTSESAVHGAVLSCIGTALLAVYHADRGRVSEAWKLAGSAMRNAQAMGLHRDPGWRKWEAMGKGESELRLMAWWSVWIVDRLYSFILGRPMMAPKGSFDVTLLPGPLHSDGTPNTNSSYLRAFIQLCEIIGESTEKASQSDLPTGLSLPSYATILECDRRFQDWLAQLPSHLQWRKSQAAPGPYNTLSPMERNTLFQRHRLATGYLDGLMNIHRPYLMHPPPILPSPAGFGHLQVTPNPSRERCIELAIELVRVLCQAHADTADWPTTPTLMFQYTYFVFDGAVTLAGALSQTPPHPRARECLDLMDRARGMLEACVGYAQGAHDGEGDIAQRALTVLAALRKAGGWGRCNSELKPDKRATPPLRGEGAEKRMEAPSSSDGASEFSFSPPSQLPVPDLPASYYVGGGAQSPAPMPHFEPSYTSLCPIPFEGQPLIMSGLGAGCPGMMLPYDMLQNSGEFEMDWARVAGIDGWQSQGGTFDPPQSSSGNI
ncbi:hypothetical protein B0H21DRAFT_810161 [Amylocystis lapponica]|nr:hypothetical protein B0H21DRAFT_810161 [Amylocystis lapponica]